MSEQNEQPRPRRTTSPPPRTSGCRSGTSWTRSAPTTTRPREKRYALTMFPYPSGDLHMGHAEVFALHDVIARYWWQRGYEVLNPMGWDSFGLPAENAAIRNDEHPATYTYANIETQDESFRRYGDLLRLVAPAAHLRPGVLPLDPVAVPEVPRARPGLPQEQPGQLVPQRPDRAGQRAGRRRPLRALRRRGHQARADPVVLQDHRVRPGAAGRPGRRWRPPGRTGSHRAAQLDRPLRGRARRLRASRAATSRSPVYTTRPDTLFGATFMVVAADAALAAELVHRRAARRRSRPTWTRSARPPRSSGCRPTGPKTGVFLGVTRPTRSPASGSRSGRPTTCWPTTAPARSWRVPGRTSATGTSPPSSACRSSAPSQPPADFEGEALHRRRAGDQLAGQRRGSRWTSTGWRRRGQARDHRAGWRQQGAGEGTVNFRLRDWLLRRQRYWGAPIPIIHCEQCGEVAVPDDQLPVELPELRGADLKPKGVSPLAAADGLGQRRLPDVRRPGQARHRHDGHLRRLVLVLPALLLAARTTTGRSTSTQVNAWMPADIYVGGVEHAVLHLLYAPLLHQGAARHGDARLRRAVHRAAEPGLGDQPGQEDEQVAGQRRRPGRPDSTSSASTRSG